MTTKLRSLIARDVLDHLLDIAIAKQKNEIRVEAAQRRAIALSIANALTELEQKEAAEEGREPKAIQPLGDRRIRQALTTLVAKKFLRRYGRGLYRLNPNLYFVGDSDSQIEAIEQYLSEDKAEEAREAA